MEPKIAMITVAERPTAVIAARTTWPQFADVWRRLLGEVHGNVRWDGGGAKGRNVMLYRDDVPNVEVGVEVEAPMRVEGRVVRSALPAGAVAMTVHRGPYADLGQAHDAVVRWCAEHGVERAGPRWEIYGHHHDDPTQLETEIYYLLR